MPRFTLAGQQQGGTGNLRGDQTGTFVANPVRQPRFTATGGGGTLLGQAPSPANPAAGATPSPGVTQSTGSTGADPLALTQSVLGGARTGLNLLSQATAPAAGETASALNQGVGTAQAGASLFSGLTNVAGAITSDANTGSRVATGLGGALQAYGGANTLLGGALPQIPYAQYAAPLLSALGAATANSENPEMMAAQGGVGLLRGGISMLPMGGLGLSTLLSPMWEGLSDTIYNAFHEPSHAEREQAETGRAYATGRGMLRDVGYATTPEELAAVLERYNTGFAGQNEITGPTDIGGIMADPGSYRAAIAAGVNPALLTTGNDALTRAVQAQAAVLSMAQAGDPRALAYLDQQRQAGGTFRDEMLRLADPSFMGFGVGGTQNEDPYLAALRLLAGYRNDPELIRQRAPGAIASLTEDNLNPDLVPQLIPEAGAAPVPTNVSSYGVAPTTTTPATPQYVANAATAMGLPLDNGLVTPALASQVASLNSENNYYVPPTQDTMRVPDEVAQYFGLPRGAILPIAEAQRHIDNYRSGGA